MNNKERFDQLERLLVDLIRKVDRQDEFNARQEAFNARQEAFNARQDEFNSRQDEFNSRQEAFNSRQEQQLDNLSEQLNDVISILKMSAEAHKQSEERQERMLRSIEEQGRRTDATQAEILRMMQRWDEQDAHNQAVEKRLAATDNHEPRIQRLEDEALRKAS